MTGDWGKVVALIKGECANYDWEYGCLPMDRPCPQIEHRAAFEQSGQLICKYFRNNVLPLDKPLHARLTAGKGVARCTECKKEIVAASNRTKYCPECADRVDKKNRAARARERRGISVPI